MSDDPTGIDVVNMVVGKDILLRLLEAADAIVPDGIGIIVLVVDSRTVVFGGNLSEESTRETLTDVVAKMFPPGESDPIVGREDPC